MHVFGHSTRMCVMPTTRFALHFRRRSKNMHVDQLKRALDARGVPSAARHIDDGLALKIARCQGGLMPEACKHTMLSLSKNGVDDVLACHCTVLAPLYIAADDDGANSVHILFVVRKSGKLHDAISTDGRFATNVDTKVNADRDNAQITMVMRCHVAVRRVEAKDTGDTIATCIHPRPHKVSGSMRRTCRDKGDGSVLAPQRAGHA